MGNVDPAKWQMARMRKQMQMQLLGVGDHAPNMDMMQSMGYTPPEESKVRKCITSLVQSIVASTEVVQYDSDLMTIGIDSLASVELRTQLQSVFNFILPATVMMENPSISSLTRYFVDQCTARQIPWEGPKKEVMNERHEIVDVDQDLREMQEQLPERRAELERRLAEFQARMAEEKEAARRQEAKKMMPGETKEEAKARKIAEKKKKLEEIEALRKQVEEEDEEDEGTNSES